MLASPLPRSMAGKTRRTYESLERSVSVSYALPLDLAEDVTLWPPQEEISGGLEGILGDKVEVLQAIMSHIHGEIEKRKKLSGVILHDIEVDYLHARNRFQLIYSLTLGQHNPENHKVKIEQQMEMLNQEKRREMLACFQDTAGLNKELRVWFREYGDLSQRLRIVSPIHKGQSTSALLTS